MNFHTSFRYSLLALAIAGLSACGSDDNKQSAKPVTEVDKDLAIQAIWQSDGYGFVLDITDDGVDVYEVTQETCVKTDDIYGFDYAFIRADAQFYSADELGLDAEGLKVKPIKLEKVNRLPEPCINRLSPFINDVGYQFSAPDNFEVFWHTYSEHFAFSEEKSLDWSQIYQEFQTRLNDDSTEQDLAEVLDEIMARLKDGHGSVYGELSGEPFNIYYEPREGHENRVVTAFEQQSDFDDLSSYYHQIQSSWFEVLQAYIAEGYEVNSPFNETIVWSNYKGNVGYMLIEAMEEISQQEGELNEIAIEQEKQAIDVIMADAIADFEQSKGMIIDLRLNGGGSDYISLQILSHLIEQPLTIGSKYYKTLSGFSEPEDITVEPHQGNAYLGPIVVLTSDLTASAAEIFLLGLKARGNVTFIGENSNGAYSDILSKTLPNGWELGLSNEGYLDTLGNNYEITGFPVAHHIPLFDLRAATQTKDAAIDKAIELLNE